MLFKASFLSFSLRFLFNKKRVIRPVFNIKNLSFHLLEILLNLYYIMFVFLKLILIFLHLLELLVLDISPKFWLI